MNTTARNNALIAAAKLRAGALRREAGRAFWQDAGALLRRLFHTTPRKEA